MSKSSYQRAWRDKNKEAISISRKQYRLDNIEKILKQEAALRISNKENISESLRKYKYSVKGKYSLLKIEAARREHIVSISFDEYKSIAFLPCNYCKLEIPPSTGSNLDRIDNSRGYEVDNVLPCCGPCNVIRSDKLSVDEMEVAMFAVMEYRRKKRAA